VSKVNGPKEPVLPEAPLPATTRTSTPCLLQQLCVDSSKSEYGNTTQAVDHHDVFGRSSKRFKSNLEDRGSEKSSSSSPFSDDLSEFGPDVRSRMCPVPMILSPEGFGRLFKAMTGAELKPEWKLTSEKPTRIHFRPSEKEDCFVYRGDTTGEVSLITEKIAEEHRNDQLMNVNFEVRFRRIKEEIMLEDRPYKSSNAENLEAVILECQDPRIRANRYLLLPKTVDDSWLHQSLYPFVSMEQERLLIDQIPDVVKHQSKRLENIRKEITRLQSIERAPRDVSNLATVVGLSLAHCVDILLSGSLRQGNTPNGRTKTMFKEMKEFTQHIFANGKVDLLPDSRFKTWENYAAFYEQTTPIAQLIHAREVLHGGASYARCIKECETAARFLRPAVPEKKEAFLDYLREKLLQGGGISFRLTWRRLVNEILIGCSRSVIQDAYTYCAIRISFFLWQHKKHTVTWMSGLKGSPEEFKYPTMYAIHGQVLRERTDVFQAVSNAYDEVIKKLTDHFGRSFLDALNAIYADMPGFFRRAKAPWIPSEISIQEENEEENLKLISAEGGNETILCERRKANGDGICMSVGRIDTNMLVFNDLRVSGNHFAISYVDKTWAIIDRSSNGTFLNGKRLPKGVRTRLHCGDVLHLVNPSTLQQMKENPGPKAPPMSCVMSYNVVFRDNRQSSKKKSVGRVIREMKREPIGGRENDMFDPTELEERLDEVIDMLEEGFEDLRRWVADQIPLFIDSFFTKPLKSTIMDAMAKIEIKRETKLPHIDARVWQLQQIEKKTNDMIEALQKRRTNYLLGHL